MKWPKSKSERFLLTLGIGLIAIGSCYGLANWRSDVALKKIEHEWEVKGEKFDFKDFVPPPVPDDQNFALTPIVASGYAEYLNTNGIIIGVRNTNVVNRLKMEFYPDGDWHLHWTNAGDWRLGTKTDLKIMQSYFRDQAANTNQSVSFQNTQSPANDVLKVLSKYDADITELRTAAQMLNSRFPLNYDTEPKFGILLPHLAALRNCSITLQLRACAELQKGESQKALEDIQLILRLADSIHTEPFDISQLVRLTIVNLAVQPIWEGLENHNWTDAQLVELNAVLSRLDFLADYGLAMRGDRACFINIVAYLSHSRNLADWVSGPESLAGDDTSRGPQGEFDRSFTSTIFYFVPTSVFYQNELNYVRIHQLYGLPIIDTKNRTASPSAAVQFEKAVGHLREHWSPNHIFTVLLMTPCEALARRFACAQGSIDMARVACALERYRLVHGDYPETLEVLTSQFIDAVPHDIIGGQPLHYRREANGKFMIYSVGWNERDDDGTVVLYPGSGTRIDISKGDWVWKN